MDLFLISLTSLFSIINPLGTIPLFVSLTKDKTNKEKANITIKTTFSVFIILIISFFLGKYLLVFFGISLPSLKIAGGLIIASSGFALLTGSFSKHKGMKKKVKEDAFSRSEISLTPLAMPMLAGPGTISLLITYNQVYVELNDKIILFLSILTISILIFILLKSSNFIVKILGDSGINALSRIIGFVLIAIGIEYILSTIISLSK
ncbi:MAG: antibiotic resistance protein MarC [Bacteroidetes bacterium GWA2_32_17]|nr:MAG: antibiotic resistance protein MarC [Bacteroidetes bacterium GWA2_32_17]